MMTVLANLLAAVLVGGLLYLLWSIIRFSMVAPFRTRNAPERLRRPSTSGLEQLVGFPVPAQLVDFYASWPHLERTEYVLINIDEVARFRAAAYEDITGDEDS